MQLLEFKRERGYKDRGRYQAVSLTIAQATTAEIVAAAEGALVIWHMLSRAVADWRDMRLRLYDQAKSLLATIQAEDVAVQKISDRQEPQE